MEIVEVKHCYACGSAVFEAAFAMETSRHSSLMRVDATGLSAAAQAAQKTFAKPSWKICCDCGLIFAGKRPSNESSEDWYLDLFKLSEERGYDVTPLPPDYILGKENSGKRLFDLLSTNGLVPKGGSVLHIRCATGTFLREAQNQFQAEIAGTDFFAAGVAHANAVLGGNVVKQMAGPQPNNPFPDRRYDLIVSNHMITHAHDPATLVRHFREWLKPDGVLVVLNEPDHGQKLKSLKAYPRGINFFHKQLFSEATFRSAMAQWGFSLEPMQHANQKKRSRDMIFACRLAAPSDKPTSSAAASRMLLRQWSMRRRISEWLGLIKAG